MPGVVESALGALRRAKFEGLVLPTQLVGCARGWALREDHGQIRIHARALREQAVAQILNLSLRDHGALLDASCKTLRQAKNCVDDRIVGLGDHVSDDAERRVRAMAPTLAPTTSAPNDEAARLALAATIPPMANALGHAPTMMGLPAEAEAPKRDLEIAPTMMGLPAEAEAPKRDLGYAPTMMGLPAEAEAPKRDLGYAPTMMGLPAEAPRAPAPVPSALAPPVVLMPPVHPSMRASTLPVVAPTIAPPRSSRSPSRWRGLALAAAGLLVLGGVGWVVLRDTKPKPTATPSPEEPAAVATPADAPKPPRRDPLAPPPLPAEKADGKDESGERGSRSGPLRRLGRRLGR
jgi:hypothetical protein